MSNKMPLQVDHAAAQVDLHADAFAGGDESDGSSQDDWDVGWYHRKQVTDAVVPDAEDSVSNLERAVSSGDVQRVQRLLDNGVDVETRLGHEEWTPLMCAVHAAHYDVTKLLLDRGASANYSKDQFTVLMAACTADVVEDRMVRCVELLLANESDPNIFNSSRLTSLMLAAREGYGQLIHLLVSHGAEINSQDSHGDTALTLAVQYGRDVAVLKLLHLGADQKISNKAGKTAADLAQTFRRTQIIRILANPGEALTDGLGPSREETMYKFFKGGPRAPKQSLAKLCDLELLLHGLNLEYLFDVMLENEVTWSDLLTMEKDDLENMGIDDPEDQRKVLSALQEMHLDRVDLDTLRQLGNIHTGSEELYNFLISLRQQCCYLTEMVQDVIGRFPRSASELVLGLDPQGKAQAICSELVVQTKDLQKEVTCLGNLLRKMDQTGDPCCLPGPGSHGSWGRRVLKSCALSMLGAGLLFLLARAKGVK